MAPEIRQRKLSIGRQYADDHHRRNGGTRHNTAGEQPAGNYSDWSCSRGRKRTVKTETISEQTGLPQTEFNVCGSPVLLSICRDYQLKFNTTGLLSSIVFRSAVLKIWNENSTVSKFSMLFSSNSVELKTMQSTALFPAQTSQEKQVPTVNPFTDSSRVWTVMSFMHNFGGTIKKPHEWNASNAFRGSVGTRIPKSDILSLNSWLFSPASI